MKELGKSMRVFNILILACTILMIVANQRGMELDWIIVLAPLWGWAAIQGILSVVFVVAKRVLGTLKD